ncbi:hypothetical protein A3B21_05105 [Candidatus Uhrbacteria bacterium RIFCSPLOWO2_01_FULL_47_24]|uniref:GIY-YIG domain-containing protein n=1 Tax=Candidatus Uhrbacteria bacterium RIFCSPLOWO2_01_FULL_47_24 TaxID=1802401 RepID=A0A1F7UWF3_9BACT|nr:MAG: hypothetical protein A2753_03140 [Candidatus Uhrbacteria bacterium RIFCSPHIGHO2_01_FULL_47_11]OGL69329.1 MAG: hypothetical protein A3D58_03495 [Candidatus Uhrbacteria bacterium RIFCSPHIGHO2_02_FULL_46_47]OGL76399.1 MAG: hypothetical protein A3F52_00785 [Candidatus Uhrbacteria bacterium RIFCSPHIGHO2_12_FULL_47_11]OGL82064.1 MAG: hypothetical protein A3B21_05105 [Candidatus Uhrbacteria bacterium RIFCSPLOWO2_01_FULL_47_24]OGL85458.1 MAG: hypothetical protein A3J03_05270 [Candidatus Uhrbact
MFFVYILRSLKDQGTYTGYSGDMNARLIDHNKGRVDATRNRRPLVILYTERCTTEQAAKMRERYWKSGAGRRKLKKYFREGFPPCPPQP